MVFMAVMAGFMAGGCSRHSGKMPDESVTPANPPPAPRILHAFCYHGVEDSPSNQFFNRTEDFTSQMQALADEGFQTITCSQWADYLAGNQELPDRPVLLTIDDGNSSVYDTIHPILQQHGFTATLFIYTSAIDTHGHMTWEQVKELHSQGYEIGSHTVSHANLIKAGDGQSLEEHQRQVVEELMASKAQIEQVLGETIDAFAYPYGNYDEAVIAAVRQAGYRVAFSIDRGAADEGSDQWRLPRQMVVRDNSLRTFKRWLEMEPLHLADISPPVGQNVRDVLVQIRARVVDASVKPSEIVAEAGKQTNVTTDDQTREIVISTSLAAGANNIRLQHQGSPAREMSWVIVYRP
jgi:peptidoglycan/xylan/chitin deacetylase (PgdA/CDA1 family)